MPAPFKRLTIAEFALLVERFPWSRRVTAVHMHHTWRPNKAQFRGHESIASMWRFHTRERGFSDIAQHLTIAPDGGLWTGRNWNAAPASASGHNGNAIGGPFMFELVGDFDRGYDVLADAQLQTALDVIRLVQRKFGLPPEALLFHNQVAPKSCPGSSIEFNAFVAQLQTHAISVTAVPGARGTAGPFGEAPTAAGDAVQQAIRILTAPTGARAGDPPDAELDYGDESRSALIESTRGARARGEELDAAMIERLRPHVVNLRMGRFSSDGRMTTQPEDVDAIFEEELPKFLAARAAAGDGGRVPLVFYAHGGLVAESKGLLIAAKHLEFWKRNGVYPICFIWETGLFETIGQLLDRSRAKAAPEGQRGGPADWLSDPMLEETVRALQAPRIWGGMKASAAAACEAQGAATYVARKLGAFLRLHADKVELHAIGHSADSIFQAHFVPACREVAAAKFSTMQLLAPAVTVAEFNRRLLPLATAGEVAHTTIFTMRRSFEQDDHCAQVYRKSLLYLVMEACEPERRTPILGLAECLRRDAGLKDLFGLGGVASTRGEVVWSKSESEDGRSASTSTSHGGFDDDAPTMNSVLRRVRGLKDEDPIEAYADVAGSRAAGASGGEREWSSEVDWPEFFNRPEPIPSQPVPAPGAAVAPTAVSQASGLPAQASAQPGPGALPAAVTAAAASGRRLALTIGINAYPTAPLHGCIADADLWHKTLQGLGFQMRSPLRDQDATRDGIVAALSALIGEARAGDTLVVQYAGHGAQVPDVDGDEAGGDTPGEDEALCPVDFADGKFVIDDDIAALIARLPEGAQLTFLLDCCHSGTASRFAGNPADQKPVDPTARARFVPMTDALRQAHRADRESMAAGRGKAASPRFGFGGAAQRASMREVCFAACQSHEVAWEVQGQGEFTRRAHEVLAARGARGLSNFAFQEAVLRAFGPKARQTPLLDCDVSMRDAPWLGIGSAAT